MEFPHKILKYRCFMVNNQTYGDTGIQMIVVINDGWMMIVECGAVASDTVIYTLVYINPMN
jgi:hypothetical protein